jgi:exonuclease 3'-5' domain-containing protein 1
MSIESAAIGTTVVDSVSLLKSVIDAVIELPKNFSSLFIDLEGINLGRNGSVFIVSLYLPSRKRVYLIDVHRLGAEAFSTVNSEGKSLKSILKSPVILKVLFDVRHDPDALFSHYGISFDGIRDVQLMEIGTRKGSKDFVLGLSKCVAKDSTISAAEKKAWELTKSNTRRLFDPTLGGRYEIFNERPLPPAIVEYCAGDVTLLPDLFNTYDAKLRRPGEEIWQSRVLQATKERIKLSQSPTFDGTSTSNTRGPWNSIEEPIDQCHNDDPYSELLWDEIFESKDFDDWEDDGPTSCRDIINNCDYDYYYSD